LHLDQSNPVTVKERIVSLDVLRGVAVLGILLMNSVSFALVMGAYESPMVYNDMAGVDWWTWLILHFAADQKFVTIFSILFGAGVCIFMERAAKKGHNAWKLQLSRMGWLLFIGMFHAYMIWFGDILFSYAIAGVCIALCRNWKPKTLIPLGIFLGMVIPIAVFMFIHWTVQYWPEESIVEMQNGDLLESKQVMAEITTYSGPYTGQFAHRMMVALMMHFFILPIYLIWRVAGLMMLGMAAYKMGILSAKKSKTFYISMLGVGLIIGLPLIWCGVWFKQQHGWDAIQMRFQDSSWNVVGSTFIACAWIALVMLLCKSTILQWLQKALAAVGRMALTNYLMQSIIGTLIFYGHGFGLFNKLERFELLWFVACVWIFQIFFSIFWLKYFKFGPFEWFWRSLTYLKLQSMK